MPAIRPLALGIIRRGEELLVFRGSDDVKGETFHRPLGGGIEFGEHADEALRREFQEELAAEVTDIALLGVVENIFTTNGRDGHEIAFLFSARFTDESLYRQEEIKILDEDNVARWVPVEDFYTGRAILYPEGLTGLLGSGGGKSVLTLFSTHDRPGPSMPQRNAGSPVTAWPSESACISSVPS